MRRGTAAAVALAGLLAAACSSGSDAADTGPDEAPDSSSGHGEVAGATEVAEPPLHLLTVDAAGEVGLTDLLSDATTDVGTIAPPSAVATDGRYLFATTPDGLAVVDSGLWTWDHGDHFHYYRAEPALVGTVPGAGAPTVATGPLSTTGGTGVLFPESGEAVLLDNEALHDGRPGELFRVDVGPHDGLVAPFADGAVVSVPDRSGRATAVRRLDADGDPVPGSTEPCREPSGTITTAVGLVVGCADGALLLTEDAGEPAAERVRYPRGIDAPRALGFEARAGRPTVAGLVGLAGTDRYWLLDTRERTWQLREAGTSLLQVSAADDEEGHVVALDRRGRVRVYLAGSGRQVAVTTPLLSSPAAPGVDLVVDDERAYLNDPGGDRVLEIDYADGARVARELATPTAPDFLAEVGR